MIQFHFKFLVVFSECFYRQHVFCKMFSVSELSDTDKESKDNLIMNNYLFINKNLLINKKNLINKNLLINKNVSINKKLLINKNL